MPGVLITFSLVSSQYSGMPWREDMPQVGC